MNDRRSLRTFRRHLMLTSALVTASFAAVAAAMLFVPLFATFGRAGLSPEALSGVAAYVLELHQMFWPVIACALIASVASGIVLFDRMRSPLARFVRAFDEIAAGRATKPVRIRRIDYLQLEADALNRMIHEIGERNRVIHQELARLDQALREIEPASHAPKVEAACAEARQALRSIQERSTDLA